MLKQYSWLILPFLVAVYLLGRSWYFQPKYDDGIAAPNFEAQLRDGSPFTLDDLRGNYVLLDFWGSWCGPCRAQHPQLRALYERFGTAKNAAGAGFKIVSVAVEKRATSWERAIAADQLNWPYHIMDASTSLKFFNGPISKLYGITQVPAHYLINPEGQIMASDPSLEEVAAVLTKALTN